MAAGDEESLPDLRPRPRRPRALYFIVGAYLCGLAFFAGGGIHQLGGLFILPGLLLWAAGGVWALSDMSFPERRHSGIAALVAAVALWPAFSWLFAAVAGR
jgi:hypothetical protein